MQDSDLIYKKVWDHYNQITHFTKEEFDQIIELSSITTVKKGELLFKQGTIPGERYTVKPMELHAFFNPGGRPVKFRALIEPGHQGFENSWRILYGLAADGLTDNKSVPKNLTHTALLLTMSDMNAPGFLTWIFPLLQWIAKREKAKREEQRLMQQYC